MNIRTRFVAAVALSAILVILVPAFAQAQQAGGKRSPELQVLERFIGSWEETIELKRAAWTPEPSTKKISSTRKWILDGKMIENKGAWSPGNVEFLHLTTYDPKRREYRKWYFDANNPVPIGGNRGHWDEATQTMTWRGALEDGVTTATTERFIDKDTFTWTFVAKDRSGEVVLNMEAQVRRRQR